MSQWGARDHGVNEDQGIIGLIQIQSIQATFDPEHYTLIKSLLCHCYIIWRHYYVIITSLGIQGIQGI